MGEYHGKKQKTTILFIFMGRPPQKMGKVKQIKIVDSEWEEECSRKISKSEDNQETRQGGINIYGF
jgi:hypothetical protein